MHTVLLVAGLSILIVAVNIPLGYLRQSCPKFSFGWYFYIHISIPAIIYLRVKMGLGWPVVPFTLASAVIGQLIGGRLAKKKRCDLG